MQEIGVAALPVLLDVMDNFVSTNLSAADVLTLAATIYGPDGVDPGPMPTLTASDLGSLGFGAYNLNAGNLPNVVVEGYNGYLWKNDAGQINFNQFFVKGHYDTFADFADGTLDNLPIYEYYSGDPTKPYDCVPRDYFIDDNDSIRRSDPPPRHVRQPPPSSRRQRPQPCRPRQPPRPCRPRQPLPHRPPTINRRK